MELLKSAFAKMLENLLRNLSSGPGILIIEFTIFTSCYYLETLNFLSKLEEMLDYCS